MWSVSERIEKNTVVKMGGIQVSWDLRTMVRHLNFIPVAMGSDWRGLCREMTGSDVHFCIDLAVQ